MNIAGEGKRTPLTEILFLAGMRRIEKTMPRALYQEVWQEKTGSEAFYVFDAPAEETKRIMVAVEESDNAARLFDIDVIGADGEKLSRPSLRSCIVCGGPVTACARSRAHGLKEITAHTEALLQDHAAECLASLAYNALIREVEATPKPGLVDRNNNGSHKDMDLSLFYKSAAAIRPHFANMARIAFTMADDAPGSVMAALRKEGILAEQSMFRATGGVNTHKGAVFSMGLLLAGQAIALKKGGKATAYAADIAKSDLAASFRKAESMPETNGEHIYRRYKIEGARGEAALGFPTAEKAEAVYYSYLSAGKEENEALALTLPHIMASLDDTNLVHRGGEEGLSYAQHCAKRILTLRQNRRMDALRLLDGEFILRDLSPGGSADMLALAVLLHECKKLPC
ncbi:MAG: hypothetical protein E7330_04945, partial [Clostridiales bacterium]|nr:hypothetical protein [Clostridiales bacterium]